MKKKGRNKNLKRPVSLRIMSLLLYLILAQCVKVASVTATPIISDISLGQTNWLRPDSSVAAANSVWGVFSFSAVPDPSDTFFLNMVATNGATSAWSVQNLPLTSFVSGKQTVDVDLYELGISPGTDLTQLQILVSVDPAVRQTAPDGPSILLNVADYDRLAWDSYDIEGQFDPGCPKGIKSNSAPIPNPNPNPVAPHDLQPLQEDVNGCFPGSMARSLDWLNRTYGLKDSKDKDINDFYSDLVVLTGIPPYAPDSERRIEHKAMYAHNLGVDTKVFDAIGGLDPIFGVTETTPDQMNLIDWLLQEFRQGEDIEIAYKWMNVKTGRTGGHIVSLVDIYQTANNQTIINYRDDERQGIGSEGDDSTKWAELITKADGTIGFRSGLNTVMFAVSESPVPEFSTILLFGFGYLGLLGVGEIKKRVWKG